MVLEVFMEIHFIVLHSPFTALTHLVSVGFGLMIFEAQLGRLPGEFVMLYNVQAKQTVSDVGKMGKNAIPLRRLPTSTSFLWKILKAI